MWTYIGRILAAHIVKRCEVGRYRQQSKGLRIPLIHPALFGSTIANLTQNVVCRSRFGEGNRCAR